MQDADVVIVGGGPAGLSTALHLQAAAPRTRMIVLEAERYPREKICAGGIGARGLRRLEKLGIAVDCPMVKVDAIALKFGGETIVTRDPGLGVVVRRVEFDHALAKQAMARGIDVRDGCEVTAITLDEDHVRIDTPAGSIRARALVGADGVSGIVRRAAGFPRSELRAQVVELDTEAVASDLPRDTLVFDFTAADLHGYAWDFPTQVAGQPLVCRGTYVLHHLGPDSPKQRMQRYLAERGLDLSRYRLKQFAERGFEPGAPIARPRVLLVGEAAGIDIATGEGIAQAIEYGSLAGPYLARALERDDVRFSDWTAHVTRRHLGVQMRVRHAMYRYYYSPKRPKIERLMPRLPALVRIGVNDFSGRPVKLAAARGGLQLLGVLAREKMRDPV